MANTFSLRAGVRTAAVLLAILGLWLSVFGDVQARTWTRQNGDQFDADFVRQEGGNGGFVVLRKLSGAEMSIRLWNLSEQDQECVKQLSAKTKSEVKSAPRLPSPPSETKAAANPEPVTTESNKTATGETAETPLSAPVMNDGVENLPKTRRLLRRVLTVFPRPVYQGRGRRS